MADISDLVGKTILGITGLEAGSDRVVFQTEEGIDYHMYHEQDCCEAVRIEDVCGDYNDLLGVPIAEAYVETSETNPPDVKINPEYQESFTWTFYRIATIKGTVTVRWYGSSNGYYSESVYFSENGKRAWE